MRSWWEVGEKLVRSWWEVGGKLYVCMYVFYLAESIKVTYHY